jgi:hypothetical protein
MMTMQTHLTQQHLKNNPEKLARFNKVIIRSGQWGYWWRANGAGYTGRIEEAGIYEVNDAWLSVKHCGPEKKIVLHAAKTSKE